MNNKTLRPAFDNITYYFTKKYSNKKKSCHKSLNFFSKAEKIQVILSIQ